MTTPLNLTNLRAEAYRDAVADQDRGPIAFVAVVPDEKMDGINGALGIAVANEGGYTPVPLGWARYATQNAAAEHADILNAHLGHDAETAFRIVASTMGGRRYVADHAGEKLA